MTHAILDDAWLRRYEQVLEQVREKQEHLRATVVPRLEHALSTDVSLLAGVAGGLLEPKLREALHDVDNFLSEVGVLVESGGLPLRLAYNTPGWMGLHAQAGTGSHRLGITTAQVRQTWQGLSAYAYLYVRDTQLRATDRLSEVCESAAAQLASGAEDALAFFIALLILLVSIETLLVGAVAAASTVAGLPAALQSLYGAVSAFTGLYLGVRAQQQNWQRRAAELAKLVDALGNHDTFPGGHWPPANTAGFRDGSVRDGTPTDWTYHDTVSRHGPLPS